MDEFDLDFLRTPTQDGDNKTVGGSFVFNEFDVSVAKKKSSKKFELAANIAKVDELVQEIDQLKSKNNDLQHQLRGFQTTAQEVQELYIKEKNENSVAKQDLERLQKEHANIDEKLANMILVNEQLKARLDAFEGRPISFENLVVKYVRVLTKLHEDDMIKYSQDKDLLERLRDYCIDMKYKVPRANSPKKSRSRGNKPQTREAFVQCELIAETILNVPDCVACKSKAIMQNQSTLCSSTKRDQASQYISTMVTRQTNTENIVQKHAQTMFPEPPAVDDILRIFSKWSNIRSVSPLKESPPRIRPSKEILIKFSTTGTCTMLCNVRRKIDYLPTHSSSNIKEEYFTPSASPTPNTDTTSTNAARVNLLSNNAAGNINSSSLLSLFNSTANSSLGQLSFSAFNELWQIFGKMLLSLIQNSNTGVASTNQSAHINQQQFLDWLLQLYTNSKEHNPSTEAIHNQILEQRAVNDTMSPVFFNDTSVLSTNILRPQPQKTLPEENVDIRTEVIEAAKETFNSNLIDLSSNRRISITGPSDILLENSVLNRMPSQLITSSSNKTQATNLQQKGKTKKKTLDEREIKQEILPEMKLPKKNKRKILKRLLNNKRKNSKEFKKHKNLKVEDKKSSVVILAEYCNNEDTTETAIDFLKTFAVAEQNIQPIEENFSETEKAFFKQVTNIETVDNIVNNSETSLEFEATSCSPVQSSAATSAPTKYTKRIETQYQMLFGDTDDEEEESSELEAKPVIKANIDLGSSSSMHHIKTCNDGVPKKYDDLFNCSQENSEGIISVENTFAGDTHLATQINNVNMPHEAVVMSENAFSIDDSEQNTITTMSASSINQNRHISLRNATQNSIVTTKNPNISAQAMQIPNDVEYTYLPDIMQIPETQHIGADNNLQNLHPSLIINNFSFTNIEKSLVNDFDFPLYKQDHEVVAKASEISKTETEIVDACLRPELQTSRGTANKQDFTVQTVERNIAANVKSLPRLTEEECFNTSRQSQPIIISSTTILPKNRFAIESIEEIFQQKTALEEDNTAIITLPKAQKTGDNFAPHEQAFENHKAELITSQKSCLLNSFSESKSIPNTPNQNAKLESKENSGEKIGLKSTDTAHEQQNYEHAQTPTKTKGHCKQMLSTSSSLVPNQSQYDINETLISSADAIVIATDSTSSDGSIKNGQLLKACNKESNEKDLPKISRLDSLKLLHLNKTAAQQNSSSNIEPNANEVNANTMCRKDTNLTERISACRITSKETGSKDVTTKTNNEQNYEFEGKDFVRQQFSGMHELENQQSESSLERITFEESFLTNINKVPIEYEERDETDDSNLSDSSSMEDELMIDEESSETTSKQLQTNPLDMPLPEAAENCNGTLDASNISTLLNSSVYGEILSESFKPIVSDLLQEDFLISSSTPVVKTKSGRKRKNEPAQPCKRSQRLQAKQMLLANSFNLSKTQTEFVKYPNHKNVLNGVPQKSPQKADIHKTVEITNTEIFQQTEMLENTNTPQLGFFREIDVEDGQTNISNQTINTTNVRQIEAETDEARKICETQNENQKKNPPETLDQNICPIYEKEQDGEIFYSPDDCSNNLPADNFIYTDSPQSPTPIETLQIDHTSQTCRDIPLEHPLQFLPQANNANLFDNLINSYKNEHQKQILESIAHKELKRKEHILEQFKEQITLYCNDAMELDLFCTSNRLLNKLLSLSPDYDLIQRAVIYVAQHAAGADVKENDLPSIIQEMPPRHLSKCLQRLFTFLRIIVKGHTSFCQELISRIEKLLFNPKQMENLSLQATLNLTQLFLMACKVQEYLQTPKHPARLFIAKCLYYYLQKSVLIVHEVLLWCPTVLPHREDKTYDRSDALITVIQQILMNTKYDMDKADLRGKLLISKLRFEYHFEPFKPTQEEVINVLVEKLKNSKFYNISLAFCLICKRVGVVRTQNIVLDKHLLPLANEYYCLALKTNEYDARIEILLEIISLLVKAMPLETKTKKYFCEFARFLNGFERQTIQEAALCSILRLQRFDAEHCYSLLSHFQPTYNLNAHTQAMLKSFLYRRPLNYWKTLNSKSRLSS